MSGGLWVGRRVRHEPAPGPYASRLPRVGQQAGPPQAPAEKGRKAACLTKRPWASRKCSGWKRKGSFQAVSSFSTDDRLVMSVVPWQETPHVGGSGWGMPGPLPPNSRAHTVWTSPAQAISLTPWAPVTCLSWGLPATRPCSQGSSNT